MPSYLQKRRRKWYAVYEIPDAVRPRFGKKKARFVKSLDTESQKIAERRVLPIVAGWRKQIAEARGEAVDDDAAFFRRSLKNAKSEAEREQIREQIEMQADHIGSLTVENIGDRPSSSPEAQRFYAEATGSRVPFTEHLDEWMADSKATDKTKDMQRSDVKRFAARFANVEDVKRADVRRWISALMNEDGLTPKTVQRVLSALRGYWRYLQSINVADEDHEPFQKLDVARQDKRNAPRSTRQPFKPADVLALLDKAIAEDDEELADLIRLGMWSGCRIEELCSLKVENVHDDYFSVIDAKTAAGWRDVPIHKELQQTMARLIDGRKTGYVLAGMTENKYGDRSNAIGKRFGRMKVGLKFGPQFVFHSIRKTVATQLENAGVPENVSADIVGHDKPTMTYGLYSGGVSLAVKRKALAKLAY